MDLSLRYPYFMNRLKPKNVKLNINILFTYTLDFMSVLLQSVDIFGVIDSANVILKGL